MDSVITRITLSEVEPEKFAISKPHIKQTKKLLKEALAAERGEENVVEDEGTICMIDYDLIPSGDRGRRRSEGWGGGGGRCSLSNIG